MTRRLMWMVAAAALFAPAARAQDYKVELSGTAGWVFSDGVSASNADFIRLDPKDAFSWGARIGFLVNENVEVGGLFNLQSTTYELGLDGGGLDWAAGFGSGVTPVATAGVGVGAGPRIVSRAILTPKKRAITPTISTAPRIKV